MATSGSTDFNMTGQDIVTDALLEIGAISEEEAPTASQQQKALRRLNAMIKDWQTEGLYLWKLSEGSFTPTVQQASFDFGTGGDFATRAILIDGMRRRQSNTDVPLRQVSRAEYFNQADKTTDGIPTLFYYDPQILSGKLYIWPRVQTGLTNTLTLHFTYRSTIEDFDAGANDADFPQEWYEALVTNLAVRLAPSYGSNSLSPITLELARSSLNQMRGHSRGQQSVFAQPSRYGAMATSNQ